MDHVPPPSPSSYIYKNINEENPQTAPYNPEAIPRRDRMTGKASAFTPFDLRAKEPGIMDEKDILNIHTFLLQTSSLPPTPSLPTTWSTEIIPPAFNTYLASINYLPSPCRSPIREVNKTIYSMSKPTTIGLQTWLNDESKQLEVDGLFGPLTIEALVEYVNLWVSKNYMRTRAE
ncbi:hypothetical protein TrLO_g7424 [Triparma laevis f. longispina]|uniref:Uncharacterized protein n=1 Tax=Triparma laevis f. longispina TaxID=1714387 RepID=A0A9W7F687_9STRA|nr:hypothetical protein TrLO_g7424 [Triparma laevis f. longispina]